MKGSVLPLPMSAVPPPERVDLSVLLPVYNEQGSLHELHNELDAELRKLDITYQIVFVNDGSRDNSRAILEEIAAAHPETVIFVDFRRNFGQTAATMAGFDHSTGDIVMIMDADLQNDPADIEMLMEILDEGYDVVSGWRVDRKDDFWTRRFPSMVANWLISEVTKVRLHDYGCTLKAYRREIIDDIQLYGEMHRFIPVYAVKAGARMTEVPVNHRPRIHDRSKYDLTRTFRVILDLITVQVLLNYHTKPTYVVGGAGLIFIGVSMLTALAGLVKPLVIEGAVIGSQLLTLSAILFAFGIQALLMGIIAELLMRTYFESQDKRQYIVDRLFRGGDVYINRPL